MSKPSFKNTIPNGSVVKAFESTLITLSIDQIMATKLLDNRYNTSPKYKMIVTSIAEIGIVEPPAVIRNRQSERYILLDGHLRIAALKELGKTEVTCLLSSDDETYTFNKHTNRLSPIQEHRMISRALERGVTEEKLAKALNLDMRSLVRKKSMLKGICPEVVEMLKDKVIAEGVFKILKRMKEYRQIESVILMNNMNDYTISYATSMLGGTPSKHLVEGEKGKNIKGLDKNQIACMENEMTSLHKNSVVINERLGPDTLNLQVAKKYLVKLLSNERVAKHLAQHHTDILGQFQQITEMMSLVGEK